MAEIIKMPRLSDTMTEGVVAKWLKKVGDSIAEGDILAEIETDKATMEFESFNEGTLLYIGLEEGQSAPVDSLLAIIGEKGTDVASLIESFATKNDTPEPQEKELEELEEIKNTPEKENIPEKKLEEKPKEKIILSEVKNVSPVASENGRIIASPLAKKLAHEKGIHLAKIVGTGPGGRIVKTDIENFNSILQISSENTRPITQISTSEIPNSQMRKVIAKRLGESKFSAPHYYLGMEIDMDAAIASRKKINAIPETKISFNDMVVKACAMALKLHPQINTEWDSEKIIYNAHVNIGVAVAVEDGLLVPVIPFTDTKNLKQIGAEIKEKAIKAKNKKLTPSEMEGSTFTVSNLGMFGIDEFTSIINQPNSAILSVGGIKQKPVVKNENIVVGNVMKITLACDHRTIDGATAAAFLNTLKQFIENPVTMLA